MLLLLACCQIPRMAAFWGGVLLRRGINLFVSQRRNFFTGTRGEDQSEDVGLVDHER